MSSSPLIILGGLSGPLSLFMRMLLAEKHVLRHFKTPEELAGHKDKLNNESLIFVDAAFPWDDLFKQHASRLRILTRSDADSEKLQHWVKQGCSKFITLPTTPAVLDKILTSAQPARSDKPDITSQVPEMQHILALVDKVSQSDASVLITGESGTGKEVIARRIHRKSPRTRAPFIAINCAAIPDTLLESELFGHEKGAFTGAMTRRIGKFEEASGGTLLLDEIGEMPLGLQAKLLRVLQERELVRIGGKDLVPINIRVLATTNRDLREAIKENIFREDLYFRLNVVNLQLPALRERKDDILDLAKTFLEKYQNIQKIDAQDRPPEPSTLKTFSQDIEKALRAHTWPGNIRELENTIQRALIFASGTQITSKDLALPQAQSASLNTSTIPFNPSTPPVFLKPKKNSTGSNPSSRTRPS